MVKPIKKRAPKTAELRAKDKLAEMRHHQQAERELHLGLKNTWHIPLFHIPDHLRGMRQKMHEMEDYLSKHDVRITVNNELKSVNPFFESTSDNLSDKLITFNPCRSGLNIICAMDILSATINPTDATGLYLKSWLICVFSAYDERAYLSWLADVYWSAQGTPDTDTDLESTLSDYLHVLGELKETLDDISSASRDLGEAH